MRVLARRAVWVCGASPRAPLCGALGRARPPRGAGSCPTLPLRPEGVGGPQPSRVWGLRPSHPVRRFAPWGFPGRAGLRGCGPFSLPPTRPFGCGGFAPHTPGGAARRGVPCGWPSPLGAGCLSLGLLGARGLVVLRVVGAPPGSPPRGRRRDRSCRGVPGFAAGPLRGRPCTAPPPLTGRLPRRSRTRQGAGSPSPAAVGVPVPPPARTRRGAGNLGVPHAPRA